MPDLSTIQAQGDRLRRPLRQVSDDVIAIQQLFQQDVEFRRVGNFVDSALAVVQHVAFDPGLSLETASSLSSFLISKERDLDRRLANVRALQRALASPQRQEKLVGQFDPTEPLLVGRARSTGREVLKAPDDSNLVYWRNTRDDLVGWFGSTLEELSRALGLSYATFANLGKHKPQGRTIKSVLRVHGLARAFLDAAGDPGRMWLASQGRALLCEDLDHFEATVNEQLFRNVNVSRSRIVDSTRGEDELRWDVAGKASLPAEVF